MKTRRLAPKQIEWLGETKQTPPDHYQLYGNMYAGLQLKGSTVYIHERTTSSKCG